MATFKCNCCYLFSMIYLSRESGYNFLELEGLRSLFSGCCFLSPSLFPLAFCMRILNFASEVNLMSEVASLCASSAAVSINLDWFNGWM
jgi:hypothetical protein